MIEAKNCSLKWYENVLHRLFRDKEYGCFMTIHCLKDGRKIYESRHGNRLGPNRVLGTNPQKFRRFEKWQILSIQMNSDKYPIYGFHLEGVIGVGGEEGKQTEHNPYKSAPDCNILINMYTTLNKINFKINFDFFLIMSFI